MPSLLARFDQDAVLGFALALLPRLVAAVAILLVLWLVLRATQPGLRLLLTRAEFEPTLIRLLVDQLYKGVLLVLALVMAAGQLGINVGAALAGIGIAGVALGFAAQETVANMISGFLIFWDRPFKVGDYITSQDRYGRVAEITMRTTRIRTMENTYVVIPNKQIIGDMLVNHSMYGKTRVNVPLGIAYKETISGARAVLLQAVAGLDGVAQDPPPAVVATALGDSSVNLEIRIWVADAADERPIFFRVLETAKQALDQAGIEIPFPHLQLFVEDVRRRVWEDAARFPGIGSRAG